MGGVRTCSNIRSPRPQCKRPEFGAGLHGALISWKACYGKWRKHAGQASIDPMNMGLTGQGRRSTFGYSPIQPFPRTAMNTRARTLLSLLFSAGLLHSNAPAEVYVNRTVYGTIEPMELLNRTLKLDRFYQNEYGDLYGLDPGPPFIIEAPILIGKSYAPGGEAGTRGGLRIEAFGGGAKAFRVVFAPQGGTNDPILIIANSDVIVEGDGFDPITFAGPFYFERTVSSPADSADTLTFTHCTFDLLVGMPYVTVPFSLGICRTYFGDCSFSGWYTTLSSIISCGGDRVQGSLTVERCTFENMNLIPGAYPIRVETAARVHIQRNLFKNIAFDLSDRCGVALVQSSEIGTIAGNEIEGFTTCGAIQLMGGTSVHGRATLGGSANMPFIIRWPGLTVYDGGALEILGGTVLKHYGGNAAEPSYAVLDGGKMAATGSVFTAFWDDEYGGNTDNAGPTYERWGGPTSAIRIDTTASAEFTKCLFRYPSGGIVARGNLTVQKCVVEYATDQGILIGGTQFTHAYNIMNTTIRGTTRRYTSGSASAIVVDNGGGVRQGVLLENDSLYNNTGDGVTLSCGGPLRTVVTVDRCWIGANKQYGISAFLGTGVEGLSIVNSGILCNGANGISAGVQYGTTPPATVSVEGNLIAGNGFSQLSGGVSVSDVRSRYVNNTIAMNRGPGIVLDNIDTTDGLCANNIFYANRINGLSKAETPPSPVIANAFWQNSPNDLFYYRAGSGYIQTVAALQALGGDYATNSQSNPVFLPEFTARITSLVYSTTTDQTLITLEGGALSDSIFARRFIRPDRSQPTPFLLSHVHGDTLFLWGDARPVATVGDTCAICDMHLSQSSPLIDFGRNSVVTLEKDLDGQARIMDGDKDHVYLVDIGADEFAPDSLAHGPIEILAPTKAITVVAGEPYEIRWRAQDMSSVDIDFTPDYHPPEPVAWQRLASNQSASGGTLHWDVPDSLLSTRCQIRVRNSVDSALFARSELFRGKGYVLTRLASDGSYERYTPGDDGWRCANDSASTWPESWWSQFNYETGIDPYTGSRYPPGFADSTLLNAHPWDFPDWPLFVQAFGESACYFTLVGKSYRPLALLRWKTIKKTWNGSCVGYSVSSLLGFSRKETLNSQFPAIGQVTRLHELPVSDASRSMVNLFQTRAWSADLLRALNASFKEPLETLNEIRAKLMCDTCAPRHIGIYFNIGGHAVAPYEIVREDTTTARYFILVYDPNKPGDDTPMLVLDTAAVTWFYPERPTRTVRKVFFPFPATTYLSVPSLPYLAPLAAKASSPGGHQTDTIEVYLSDAASVSIRDDADSSIGHVGGAWFNTLPDGWPILDIGDGEAGPSGYVLTSRSYRAEVNCGDEPTFSATAIGRGKAYWYSRSDANPAQKERLIIGNGLGVANPNTDSMRIRLTSIITGTTEDRVIEVANLRLLPGDSVHSLLEENDGLCLISSGSARSYIVRLQSVSGQGVTLFESEPIALMQNSTHRILPAWGEATLPTARVARDQGNDGTFEDTITVRNILVGVGNTKPGIPTEFGLDQNYPNPFNPSTVIRYRVPVRSHVSLTIYTILGQELVALLDEPRDPGTHQVAWNGVDRQGKRVPSGVYICRMKAGEFTGIIKLLHIR